MKVLPFHRFNLKITVSTKMAYDEVREISVRSGKSQGRCKSEKGGHPVLYLGSNFQKSITSMAARHSYTPPAHRENLPSSSFYRIPRSCRVYGPALLLFWMLIAWKMSSKIGENDLEISNMSRLILASP